MSQPIICTWHSASNSVARNAPKYSAASLRMATLEASHCLQTLRPETKMDEFCSSCYLNALGFGINVTKTPLHVGRFHLAGGRRALTFPKKLTSPKNRNESGPLGNDRATSDSSGFNPCAARW